MVPSAAEDLSSPFLPAPSPLPLLVPIQSKVTESPKGTLQLTKRQRLYEAEPHVHPPLLTKQQRLCDNPPPRSQLHLEGSTLLKGSTTCPEVSTPCSEGSTLGLEGFTLFKSSTLRLTIGAKDDSSECWGLQSTFMPQRGCRGQQPAATTCSGYRG